MPADPTLDSRLRVAVAAHIGNLLQHHPDGAVPSAEINTFTFEGRRVPLIVQSGIWKPAFLRAALTFRTAYTAAGQRRPYLDEIGRDGLLRYAYQGTDAQAADNRAMRQAWIEQLPLVYFVGIAKGLYRPFCPVWVVGDDPSSLRFSVAVDEGQVRLAGTGRFEVGEGFSLPSPVRAYSLRLTKQRLHQQVFRTQVLYAYQDSCAMCNLRHAELLDAAHIIADGDPRGEPVVPNGLSLCKIHHAAFDANIVGVRPDLRMEVRRDVLDEIDGPMLRHGLQALAGGQVQVPRTAASRPDPERLEIRYQVFRKAS